MTGAFMRKIYLLTLVSILAIQPVFAHEVMMLINSKSCQAVAKACLSAGYSRHGNKNFWGNCMKPLLLNQTVSDVKIDSTTVQSCRKDKINELKYELKELEKVS